MAMLPNYYYFVTKVKWTDGAAVVELEDHSHADVVEVVRCADCKHWYGPDDGYDHSCDVDALLRPGWWFCPAGQRREDGDA